MGVEINCQNPQVWSPNNPHCKKISTTFFGESMVLDYRLSAEKAIRSWRTFNSRLLPSIPTGRDTDFFRRSFSPCQIKHVAARRRNSITLRSTSHTILVSIIWTYLDWSWSSTCLVPIHQTWHFFIYSYGDIWRTWCSRINRRNGLKSYTVLWTALLSRRKIMTVREKQDELF
jgi:hypothetical protein